MRCLEKAGGEVRGESRGCVVELCVDELRRTDWNLGADLAILYFSPGLLDRTDRGV